MLGRKIEGRALITGASGFVGSRLRGALIDAGADVVTIRRAGSPVPKDGRSIALDYADLENLKAVVAQEKPDWIFHVAGVTKGVSYADFQRGNVMPTKNLLQAVEAGHPGLGRFVHVSSLVSYGPSTPERPHVESDPRQPIEFYGQSKLEAEEVVESYGDRLAWTIVRPGGVYGPGDVDYFNLFKSIAGGINVFFGNRDRWFSGVYVDDCVRAIVGGATSASARGRGYFVCDGVPTTWGRFQELIVAIAGRKVRTLDLPESFVDLAAFGGEMMTRLDKKPRLFNRQKAKLGAQSAWTCSHGSAREDFGYRPEVSAEEGVKRTLGWYRDQGWIR